MSNSMIDFCKSQDLTTVPKYPSLVLQVTNLNQFYLHHAGKFYRIEKNELSNSSIECDDCRLCDFTLINLEKQLESVTCFDLMDCKLVESNKLKLELLLTKDYFELYYDE